MNTTSPELSFEISVVDMKSELESLGGIFEVTVTKSRTTLGEEGVNYLWTVTFLSEWENPPLLRPLWNPYGCSECDIFDFPIADSKNVIRTYLNTPLGDWAQYPPIQAGDRRQGDRFGSNIALDGDQLVVSAIYSSGITTTTWDFECGCLEGWNTKGTAFNHQPTYGDNSYIRAVYRGKPAISLLGSGQTSNKQGRYYIGTYELRPGNSSDYKNPNSTYEAGQTQGDTPIGSITSQTFMILGTEISFLIGGGCDPVVVYVQLIIDGYGVYKATGKCNERMEREIFDVKPFYNRAAQIRIVDAGVSTWGHINVDDFQFNWDIRGGLANGTEGRSDRPVYGGQLETVHTGAVYLFRRQESIKSIQFCKVNIITCVWWPQTKITSSDKRENDQFGYSIAVNDTSGMLLVGAKQAAYTGFYKETPSVYPYRNETTGISNTYGLQFPVPQYFMSLFQALPSRTEQASGGAGVWKLREDGRVWPDAKGSERAGAVYMFVRDPATVNGGTVTVPPHWYYTESTKLQPSDEFARDYFGSSVALSSDHFVIGSPGQDLFQLDAGALYIYRAGFASLSFEQAEYRVLEGKEPHALISVIRNAAIFAGDITIEYATSDLTAKAVDPIKYAACEQLPPNRRAPAGCGDYRQSNGFLTIPEGSTYGAIKVPITNNNCLDRFLKYMQITLSVPGSAALQGETTIAKIRKDDDDFSKPIVDAQTERYREERKKERKKERKRKKMKERDLE
eukprot:CAMPEP_0182440058 /NCGR_PEP_ID=MMETSP1167-20130531/86819_1 /TAXON_ID=2988 /ORGANISM="Mallomonas Sp, Strain CCMP3275" /LENGTH=734 /DNA_ID=CAMNT_0024633901 /DNA_START=486 /DNA_END=2688 /DNA_ORIENTATION=-